MSHANTHFIPKLEAATWNPPIPQNISAKVSWARCGAPCAAVMKEASLLYQQLCSVVAILADCRLTGTRRLRPLSAVFNNLIYIVKTPSRGETH